MYDYKAGLDRLKEILDNTNHVQEVKKLPVDDEFTYDNGYKSWTGAIFVDLRNSTEIFSEQDDVDVAKMIRGFTSEIIDIIKNDTSKKSLKEIGIRGDCVYGIYSCPLKEDLYDIYFRAAYINTYMRMLNKCLEERDLPPVKAGIGLGCSKTLAVKAGRKGTGINNLVWIGNGVADAANLANIANKNGVEEIAVSSLFYSNIKDIGVKDNSEFKNWWNYNATNDFYHGNVFVTTFDNFIKNL